MPTKISWNPIAFVPIQVTIITTTVYIALFVVLIWIHAGVPSAPSNLTPEAGINLTQAWLDLDSISRSFHPYNSHTNDEVRAYLVERIEQILQDNGADYKFWGSDRELGRSSTSAEAAPKAVTVFAEDRSNVTFYDDYRNLPWTCYSESLNIVVYVRGKDDDSHDWWNLTNGQHVEQKSGVLVNAHYDSVSSGFGATDDGIGVVTILQLLSYFTVKGQQPNRGIVALLNNGEEDGLYGARNFVQHPLSRFAHTFLNLEGAGAGGRATLFRSTDAEVTKFYANSPYPLGSVVSADGFKRRLVRSGTDYSIFTESLGLRGLDVAFFEPRARYHTNEDDSRDTSPDSLWHMLSAALTTMKGLTSYTGDEFEGSMDPHGKLSSRGTDGVWFDMFGRAFAVMSLPTLFALSVVLLVAGPIILLVLEILIARNGKWYPFARKAYVFSSDDDDPVRIHGLRGFFRFPVALIASVAAVVALAFLIARINPLIIYSSEYVVWTMMLTIWFPLVWVLLAGADRVRPTALQRFYCILWMYVFSWALLVLVTVGENNFRIGGGYFIVISNASHLLAILISYLELFALPKKSAYVDDVAGAMRPGDEGPSTRPESQSSRTVLSQSRQGRAADDDEATESTSLLRGSKTQSQGTFLGFGGKRRLPETDGTFDETSNSLSSKVYGDEQAWSSSLPQWTWILQFLILGPINIILVGQLALLTTSSLHQTPADGNPVLPIYLLTAGLSVLLLIPLAPFLHRVTYHLPAFLFLIFLGCLIYNLLAFPFSRDARMKHFFVQQVELEHGTNQVVLAGLDGYIQNVIDELPSAAGQEVRCGATDLLLRPGLQTCAWQGQMPNVAPHKSMIAPYSNHSTHDDFRSWLDINITHTNTTASITLRCANSRAGGFVFDEPVSSVSIADSASPPEGSRTVAEGGSYQIHLFSRTWENTFLVNVTWDGSNGKKASPKGKKVAAVCLWSDANQIGTIPAYDEVRRFEPVWSAVTKANDGLVEGFRWFEI